MGLSVTIDPATPFTRDEENLFAPAVAAYRRVFNRPPEVRQNRLPGGSPGLLFNGWLLLYPTGIGWSVRTVGEKERFKGYPCLRKGRDVDRRNLSAAIITLTYMEAHRLFHGAA